MKSVAQILPYMPNLPENAPKSMAVDPATTEVVNELFRRLRGIFPAWRQAWPTTEALGAAKAEWIMEFVAQRITSLDQIEYGIENCRRLKKPFAPSVGEFIEMCQPTPEVLVIPSLDAAFREACRNAHPSMAGQATWSHDAVWHTAKEAGFENLNRLETSLAKKLFERNYVITVRRLVDGLPLQKMPLALPARAEGRRTPEVGNKALAELRALRSGGAHA